MKMKYLAIGAMLVSAMAGSLQAEVRTFQGTTRWATQLFTPGFRTGRVNSNYTTYYLVEYSGTTIVSTMKIDAWSSRNAYGQMVKSYYEDTTMTMEYGFFGQGGIEVAGGIESTTHSSKIPFKGSLAYRDLGAFTLIPTTDYFKKDGNLDVSTISGSARMNHAFSGYNLTMAQARSMVIRHLQGHGYYPTQTLQ